MKILLSQTLNPFCVRIKGSIQYAVNDPRGLAPTGWHIPNVQEFTLLNMTLGGYSKAENALKYPSGWEAEQNGNNKSGWSAKPGGFNDGYGGKDLGVGGFWWSSSTQDKESKFGYRSEKDGITDQYNVNNALARMITCKGGGLTFRTHTKGDGMSVRCVKN